MASESGSRTCENKKNSIHKTEKNHFSHSKIIDYILFIKEDNNNNNNQFLFFRCGPTNSSNFKYIQFHLTLLKGEKQL
jgi:hypothetical protein